MYDKKWGDNAKRKRNIETLKIDGRKSGPSSLPFEGFFFFAFVVVNFCWMINICLSQACLNPAFANC